MAKQWKKTRPDHLGEVDDSNQTASECLADWMKEMVKWGTKVKEDIEKLEKECGVTTPSPGDPPDPPWNGT